MIYWQCDLSAICSLLFRHLYVQQNKVCFLMPISLREKCLNTKFFLFRILPYLDWILTTKISVFGHFSHSAFQADCRNRNCLQSKVPESVVQRFSAKKVLLNIFWKFTRKQLCLWPTTFLKRRLWHRCFPVNFPKTLRTPFLIEDLWWLLLKSSKIVSLYVADPN